MTKERLNLYFERKTARALAEFAGMRQLSKSSVVEAAVASFLSPDSADALEAALARRLAALEREMAKLRREQVIALEALDLFIQAWLIATPPLTGGNDAAAQAKGRERYESYIERLAQRVSQGKTLGTRLSPQN